tara:strand:- start:811 stop:1266 length:456 start_codon:yes stop_codon:yes gene_type:complete
MDVILTAAVTANGMIARHSSETVEWSADLPLFRKQTMGQTVVMGSATEKTLATKLDGRSIVVMHRTMKPEVVLSEVFTDQCFIIGGAKTYTRFAPFLTHLYLTFHPIVFQSDAVPLFSDLNKELNLSLFKKVMVDEKREIYQHQYKVVACN